MEAIALGTNSLDERVQSLDFERLKWKLIDNDKEGKITSEILSQAEIEYKRFLTLMIRYPSESLAPNGLMDMMWHAHILDTKNYFQDCELLFGHYIHHRPNFGPYNEPENSSHFIDMARLMEQRYLFEFGELPLGNKKEDAACGVEENCACGGAGECAA